MNKRSDISGSTQHAEIGVVESPDRQTLSVGPIVEGTICSRLNAFELFAKRTMDVAVAAFLLMILFPFLAIAAVLIKLSSPGPVLYRWRVVGKGGVPFVSYKLRSMYVDADQRKGQLMSQNEMQGPVFKIKNDPRITPFGRFIRKYSLDELPQLWSVLMGDLSLVGPRPPLQTEYVHFSDFQKQKLTVKPGLTCLWQVSGRNDIRDFDDWVRLDLKYIETQSLLRDIQLLLRTIPVVLFGKGH